MLRLNIKLTNLPQFSMNIQVTPRISKVLSGDMGEGDEKEGLRRLLGQSSPCVTVTSSYIGVADNSALDLARTYSF